MGRGNNKKQTYEEKYSLTRKAQESAIAELGGDKDEWVKGCESDLSEKRRKYCASRTGSAFLMSYDDGVKFKCVRGPIGNGKSVLMCMYIVHKSQQQEVITTKEDGKIIRVRWSRWLIARHTYKALEETTIETWNQWFGDKTKWKYNPFKGLYEDWLEDGTLVRIELLCHATESRNIMNDLQSLELSGAWVNEATQSPYEVVARIYTRLKRFNPVPMCNVDLKTFHVIMDTNSPNETNWWRTKEEVDQPDGWLFFICPPAILEERDPVTNKVKYIPNNMENATRHNRRPAENVRETDGGYHKGLGYWTDMLSVLDDDNIRMLLMNQYGQKLSGQRVYTSWDNARHRVSDSELVFQKGMMVVIGLDLGRTPAATIGQVGPDGILRIKREVTTWNDKLANSKGGLLSVDVGTFWEEYLRPVLINEFGYPRCPHICFADPAGKNLTEVVSISSIERLKSMGLNIVACDKVPAFSSTVQDITQGNNVEIRLACVEDALKRGYIIVSDACKMLCDGFNGKYCYKKMRNVSGDGTERYSDKPDKNEWSHIHDSLQYLCLAVFKGATDYSKTSVALSSGMYNDFTYTDMGFDCDCI